MTPRKEATRYRRQYNTSSGLWQEQEDIFNMKKEATTIQELRGMARYVNREFDNLCRDWKGQTWEEAHMNYSFEDYRRALEGAGPKLKELILDRAAHDPGIHLMELKELVSSAYPEDV